MIHSQAHPGLLEFIVDRVNVGLLVLDTACNIVVFNHFLEAHSGRRSAEVLGSNVFDAFPELPRAWLSRKIKNVVLLKSFAFTSWQQRPYLFRFAHHRITSSLDYMRQDCTFIPVLDKAGDVTHVCIVVNDVTDASIAQTELERAIKDAESANQAKSDFLATMSHEIRTPLSGVIGMNQFLLETDLTAEQRDLAQTTGNCASALMYLLNDILDFSKIAAGKMELEHVEFDLRSTMEDALELVAATAHKKGLEIGLTVRQDVPERVAGDPVRLRQIVLNLLNNAIKFTESGLVSVEVTNDGRPSDAHRIRFDVRDTGVGIPADRRDRLFQSFSQVDASTTRKFGGTGLGLAICKKLAELMHGEIGIESEPGVGSNFWFAIPLAAMPTGAGQPLTTVPAGFRALAVVPAAMTRATLVAACRRFGLVMEAVDTPAAALAHLAEASRHGTRYDFCFVGAEVADAAGLLVQLQRTSTKIVSIGFLGRKNEHDGRTPAQANLNRPLRQTQVAECVARLAVSRPESPRVARPASPPAPLRNGGRILIAEDNPVNQRIASRLVEKLGFEVDVVTNGREALEASARTPYAVILMDGEMPEIDGFEATRLIREREQGSGVRVPIVAMTASAMAGDRERCLAAGMDEYVSKPISLDRLRDVLGETAGAASA